MTRRMLGLWLWMELAAFRGRRRSDARAAAMVRDLAALDRELRGIDVPTIGAPPSRVVAARPCVCCSSGAATYPERDAS